MTPHPWQRTGPGKASDGKPKFDLSRFNQAYFDRLRDRVEQLHAAGIYAGVYLFSGEWLFRFRFSGDGYPLSGSNNVNGIDDGGGTGAVTMTAPNAITAIQDAYVRKVIDTLNDLPNVLWIVSQEAPRDSKWWNSHLIALARSCEAGKPLQHPIGYGVPEDNNDATLLDSDADWIAPAARISPSRSCGRGKPACKVNINDSDHSYFGIWNDSPQAARNYFWINFTQGNQTLFMDPYVVYYPRENRNRCPSPINGISPAPDPRWDPVRDTMGYIRRYAERMNLAATRPQGKLSSTGHVLAGTDSAHAEFLVYAPSGGMFTVDLAGSSGRFAVQWMNPATGAETAGENVEGGATRTFTPPFHRDAVLYLRASARELEQIDVYQSARDGYHTYRIPSLIVTSKGTVLAFCEGRKHGSGDTGDIDLLLKRSSDGGKTFAGQQIVWHDRQSTCGNPCPVIDRQSGTIFLLMTHNLASDSEEQIIAGTSKAGRTVWVTQSNDDGLSWSTPREITAAVKKPGWTWYATGPGTGIQMSSGRLVVPCDHHEPNFPSSHVIYSDDRGRTWQLGGSAGPLTNECQVVQRTDGSLLLNMRNYDRGTAPGPLPPARTAG